MPESTRGRISTIWDPSAGPASAKGSADTRKESFFIGLDMFSRMPLTGAGIGNSAVYRQRELDGVFLASHNLYGEVLGETGLIGAMAFTFLIGSLITNVRSTKRLEKHHSCPKTRMLSEVATTCGYAIFLLLLFGLAGAGILRFHWLWLAAFVLLARNFSESVVRNEIESSTYVDEDQSDDWRTT
jgi:O-antigen ligase